MIKPVSIHEITNELSDKITNAQIIIEEAENQISLQHENIKLWQQELTACDKQIEALNNKFVDEFTEDKYYKIPPKKTYTVQIKVVEIDKHKPFTMDAEELELLMWEPGDE